MVTHPPVDADVRTVHRPRVRPIHLLRAQVLPLLGGQVRVGADIVARAEVSVAAGGDDAGADVPVLPDLTPRLGELVRMRLIEDVRLLGVVDRDVRDLIAGLVANAHLRVRPCSSRLPRARLYGTRATTGSA